MRIARAKMLEADYMGRIIDLAKLQHWMVNHQLPAKVGEPGKERWVSATQGHTGYPDLTLARVRIVHFWEIKLEDGVVDPQQRLWVEALGGKIIRPRDWGWVQEQLCAPVGVAA